MPSESQCLHLSLSLSILFIYSCLSFLELSIIRDQYMLSFSYSSFSISPPLAFFFKPQASLSFSRSSLSVFAHQVHYFSYLFFLSLYKSLPPSPPHPPVISYLNFCCHLLPSFLTFLRSLYLLIHKFVLPFYLILIFTQFLLPLFPPFHLFLNSTLAFIHFIFPFLSVFFPFLLSLSYILSTLPPSHLTSIFPSLLFFSLHSFFPSLFFLFLTSIFASLFLYLFLHLLSFIPFLLSLIQFYLVLHSYNFPHFLCSFPSSFLSIYFCPSFLLCFLLSYFFLLPSHPFLTFFSAILSFL